MKLVIQKCSLISLLLLYILPLVLNLELHTLNHNANSSTASPWLAKLNNNRRQGPGCRRQPWICDQGQPPTAGRRRCCRDRCVDLSSDVNNCGLCGIRCRFTRQCCRGICVNTNRNPNHCGKCDQRCGFRIRCIYGMCGYAQPLPPFPFPFPRPPRPIPRPPRGGGRDRSPGGGGGGRGQPPGGGRDGRGHPPVGGGDGRGHPPGGGGGAVLL